MACNKYKNKNYKSSVQFYNRAAQAVTATNTATNPLVLDFGSTVTDTGCAFDFSSRGIDITTSGLYRASAQIGITGTTDGIVTVAMTLNGTILPETIESFNLGTTARIIEVETVRALKTCCQLSNYTIGLIIYSDGTAVGTVNSVSGNVIKLA